MNDTRTINLGTTEVALILSIEDAQQLRDHLHNTNANGSRLVAVEHMLTLNIEQTIRGAGEVDTILPPHLRDAWANDVHSSRERPVSPTGGTITDIVR